MGHEGFLITPSYSCLAASFSHSLCFPIAARERGWAGGMLLAMLRDKGVLWDSMPLSYRLGLFAKKNLFTKKAVNPLTEGEEECTRGHISIVCCISSASAEKVALFVRKTW